MAKIRNTDNNKCLWEWGATGILLHGWWECEMVQPLWKTVCQLFTKLNILLQCDPAIIVRLGIYLKELKTYVHTKTCTLVFIAAVFIIVKNWEQPRCLPVGEWIKKLWCVQSGIICTNEKKWAIIKPRKDMGKSSVHTAKWNKPIWEGYSLCDCNCTTLWKRQKL